MRAGTVCMVVALPLAGCAVEVASLEPEPVGHAVSPIVGGVAANKTQIYATVALVDDKAVFCSGTVIAEKVVMTAAHCVKHFDDAKQLFVDTYEPSEVRVVAGQLNAQDPNVLKTAYEVAEIVVHDFDGSYATDPGDNPEGLAQANDIALLVTKQPIDKVAIAPILRLADFDEKVHEQDDMFITGYGLDANSTMSAVGGTLFIALAPFGHRNDYEFSGAGDGTDTCPGDSGGPAYFNSAGRTYVIGVTSRAVENAVAEVCGDGTIWTLAPAYEQWIIDNAPYTPIADDKPPALVDDSCSVTNPGGPTRGGWLALVLALALAGTPRIKKRRQLG